jgi:2-keto-4-pentenoate hydratase/2-oxohepta-3-ene-1,7-dioic acid hydratase in catechol pathway
MKLMTIATGAGTALGVVEGETVKNVSGVEPGLPHEIGAVIEGGPAMLARVAAAAAQAAATPLSAVSAALPIQPSRKLVCVGLNYLAHAAEGGHPPPTYPSFFLRVASSLLPDGGRVVRPKCSEQLDYECELAIVIGKKGRHIPEAKALEHVFGYTLFNDVSVRDYQRKTSQWTAGKNFDATGPLGPVVVTADALPPGAHGLRIQTRVNGKTMQDSNTSDLIFSCARTIAILSEIMTLEPGDIIATGTPSGVAHARKPPAWMKAGDVVEVEVEGIGVLRNPVVDEA